MKSIQLNDEPEETAVLDDYAVGKIRHVLETEIETDEDFEELGKEYDD